VQRVPDDGGERFPGPAAAYERIEPPSEGERVVSPSGHKFVYDPDFVRRRDKAGVWHGYPESEERTEATLELDSDPHWTLRVSWHGIRLWSYKNGYWMRESEAIRKHREKGDHRSPNRSNNSPSEIPLL
jgi:hypothetical protein